MTKAGILVQTMRMSYWATDPDGYYGYFHNEVLIAGGSIVSYDGKFGFMGFFIVKPEYRSLGIGRKIWYQRRDTLISRLNKGATIGMDGVVDMQLFYQKGGFEIAYRDIRYEKVGIPFKQNKKISSISDKDIPAILALINNVLVFHALSLLFPG